MSTGCFFNCYNADRRNSLVCFRGNGRNTFCKSRYHTVFIDSRNSLIVGCPHNLVGRICRRENSNERFRITFGDDQVRRNNADRNSGNRCIYDINFCGRTDHLSNLFTGCFIVRVGDHCIIIRHANNIGFGNIGCIRSNRNTAGCAVNGIFKPFICKSSGIGCFSNNSECFGSCTLHIRRSLRLCSNHRSSCIDCHCFKSYPFTCFNNRGYR